MVVGVPAETHFRGRRPFTLRIDAWEKARANGRPPHHTNLAFPPVRPPAALLSRLPLLGDSNASPLLIGSAVQGPTTTASRILE